MTDTPFALHERLAADTHFVCDCPVSRVLLMNDSRFPWLILVPRRPGLSEWFDLDPADLPRVTGEVMGAGRLLKTIAGASKINIGALGNMVPQLHIHIVARTAQDAAWPGPVWGFKGSAGGAMPYTPQACATLLGRLREGLIGIA